MFIVLIKNVGVKCDFFSIMFVCILWILEVKSKKEIYVIVLFYNIVFIF